MKSLSEKIDTKTIKDKYIYQMWNSIASILKYKYIVNEKTIEPAVADKYKFDFEGLLINELKIHKEFAYPTMLVNGYSSSYNYNGDNTKILIVDDSIMFDYLSMFARNLKEKNKLS